MAELEVKKSWFVALDTYGHAVLSHDASAAVVAASTDFKSSQQVTGTAEDRTAFLLEPSGLPDLSFDYEEVTRDVIRNSYLPAAPLRGVINTTGSMTLELHGGSASHTFIKYPDSHPMYRSAFGQANEGDTSVTLESVDLSGTTSVGATVGGTATDTSGVSVGDIVVLEGDSDSEIIVAQILVSNGTTGTMIIMYNADAIASAQAYTSISSISYSMPTTSSGIPNFAMAYYRANVVREIYAKCACTSLEFPFSAGEIVLPVFNFNVGDGEIAEQVYYTAPSTYDPMVSTAGATSSLTSSNADPLFAKAVTWKFEIYDAGTTTWYDLTKTVDSFSVTINNEASTIRDITATEGIKSYGMQGRTVDLTLSAYYDDDTFATHNITNMFLDDANNRVRISAVTGTVAGNRCFLFSPSMQFKTTVSEDAGLFKYDVTGTAEKEETYGFGENALVCVFY